jgi:hypothetical protein
MSVGTLSIHHFFHTDNSPSALKSFAPFVDTDPSFKPELLEPVKNTLRTRLYSYKTEKAYLFLIRRYMLYH